MRRKKNTTTTTTTKKKKKKKKKTDDKCRLKFGAERVKLSAAVAVPLYLFVLFSEKCSYVWKNSFFHKWIA